VDQTPKPDQAPALHAWVDESMRVPSGSMRDGIYLLAAPVADPSLCDPIREQLRRLLTGRSRRLHWRNQTPRRRRTIAATLGGFDVAHTIIVGTPIDPKRQERARRYCLERLMFELDFLGVSRVWIETRSPSLNNADRTMLAALRSRGSLPATLTVDFALPDQEPMLWLPDAVAGAIGMHRRGDDRAPYDLLQPKLTEYTITVP
jgi:hypothetical protein